MMKLSTFLSYCFFILALLAGINIPLNYLFDELVKSGRITEISSDGFNSWDFNWSNQAKTKILAPDSRFEAELKNLSEIKKSRRTIVFLGSSVVAGDGVEPGRKFIDILNRELSEKKGTYFFNAGKSGADFYTYSQPIQGLIGELGQISCVLWFPNRNDLVSIQEHMQGLEEREKALSLSSANKMPWWDIVFFGFFKRLGQRFTFEGNLLKEKSLESPHQLYYTKGLLNPMTEDVLHDLNATLISFKTLLQTHQIHFSVVFLPPRHFNHFYNWEDAASLLQINSVLSDAHISGISFFDEIKGSDHYLDYVHFNSAGHQKIADLLNSNLDRLYPP
jgi:hypothetical protein